MSKHTSRYASAPPTRMALLAYGLVRAILFVAAKLAFRVRIEGADRIPAEGAFVIAPGAHRSNLDTLILSTITRRRMRYMGKDTLWRSGFADWFLSALGGFPVNRQGADREALRQVMDIIDGGEPVVMFPEGTRGTGPVLDEMHDGPAYVACRSDVPILPVGIGGSERAMPSGSKMIRPTRMSMVVGTPIEPPATAGVRPRRSEIKALTERLRGELQPLFDRAQRLAGAD